MSLLFFFVSLKPPLQFQTPIPLSVKVKNPYIKEYSLVRCPETEGAYIEKTSPLTSMSCGSVLTTWQISLRRLAVMSRSSLCRSVTIPPFLHERAWLMSNFSPHTHSVGSRYRGSSCTVCVWHPRTAVYWDHIPTLLGEGSSASLKRHTLRWYRIAVFARLSFEERRNAMLFLEIAEIT